MTCHFNFLLFIGMIELLLWDNQCYQPSLNWPSLIFKVQKNNNKTNYSQHLLLIETFFSKRGKNLATQKRKKSIRQKVKRNLHGWMKRRKSKWYVLLFPKIFLPIDKIKSNWFFSIELFEYNHLFLDITLPSTVKSVQQNRSTWTSQNGSKSQPMKIEYFTKRKLSTGYIEKVGSWLVKDIFFCYKVAPRGYHS